MVRALAQAVMRTGLSYFYSVGIQGQGIARQSRNQRSADSFVRALLAFWSGIADKAVRAPGKSSQAATRLGDSTAKTRRGEVFETHY
jgi:hypothetical protein